MTKIQLIICDDNSGDLEALRASADDYIKQRGLYGGTACFSSPEEVLRFAENGGGGDVTVYLLDVILPGLNGLNGITLARKLRELDKSAAVIFVSSSREYSLDAFSVRAFSYLMKPFSREKLFSELDECLSQMEAAPQKLSIKISDGILSLPVSEIIAVEYLDHRLIYHLASGERIEGACRKQPFDIQAEELLQTGAFLKISASYLINAQNVRAVRSDGFVMLDGSQYKITRKYADARKKYIDYELNGGALQ